MLEPRGSCSSRSRSSIALSIAFRLMLIFDMMVLIFVIAISTALSTRLAKHDIPTDAAIFACDPSLRGLFLHCAQKLWRRIMSQTLRTQNTKIVGAPRLRIRVLVLIVAIRLVLAIVVHDRVPRVGTDEVAQSDAMRSRAYGLPGCLEAAVVLRQAQDFALLLLHSVQTPSSAALKLGTMSSAMSRLAALETRLLRCGKLGLGTIASAMPLFAAVATA